MKKKRKNIFIDMFDTYLDRYHFFDYLYLLISFSVSSCFTYFSIFHDLKYLVSGLFFVIIWLIVGYCCDYYFPKCYTRKSNATRDLFKKRSKLNEK